MQTLTRFSTIGDRARLLLVRESCEPPPVVPMGAGEAIAVGLAYGVTECWRPRLVRWTDGPEVGAGEEGDPMIIAGVERGGDNGAGRNDD
jgi:hypothetical protein